MKLYYLFLVLVHCRTRSVFTRPALAGLALTTNNTLSYIDLDKNSSLLEDGKTTKAIFPSFLYFTKNNASLLLYAIATTAGEVIIKRFSIEDKQLRKTYTFPIERYSITSDDVTGVAFAFALGKVYVTLIFTSNNVSQSRLFMSTCGSEENFNQQEFTGYVVDSGFLDVLFLYSLTGAPQTLSGKQAAMLVVTAPQSVFETGSTLKRGTSHYYIDYASDKSCCSMKRVAYCNSTSSDPIPFLLDSMNIDATMVIDLPSSNRSLLLTGHPSATLYEITSPWGPTVTPIAKLGNLAPQSLKNRRAFAIINFGSWNKWGYIYQCDVLGALDICVISQLSDSYTTGRLLSTKDTLPDDTDRFFLGFDDRACKILYRTTNSTERTATIWSYELGASRAAPIYNVSAALQVTPIDRGYSRNTTELSDLMALDLCRGRDPSCLTRSEYLEVNVTCSAKGFVTLPDLRANPLSGFPSSSPLRPRSPAPLAFNYTEGSGSQSQNNRIGATVAVSVTSIMCLIMVFCVLLSINRKVIANKRKKEERRFAKAGVPTKNMRENDYGDGINIQFDDQLQIDPPVPAEVYAPVQPPATRFMDSQFIRQ